MLWRGGRRWGPDWKVLGPVAVGAETDLSDAQFCGALAVPSGTETELSDEQFRGAVALPSEIETELKGAVSCLPCSCW